MLARILLLVAFVLTFYYYSTRPSQRTTQHTTEQQCKIEPEQGICRLQKLEATFAELGLDNVYRAPKRKINFGLCAGSCHPHTHAVLNAKGIQPHSLILELLRRNELGTRRRQRDLLLHCVPVKYNALRVLVKTNDRNSSKWKTIPGMIATACQCR